MAGWIHQDDRAGMQRLQLAETSQKHPIGMIVHGFHEDEIDRATGLAVPALGGGEFIYLHSTAAILDGSLVVYNQGPGAAADAALLAPGAGHGLPVAVALAAKPAGASDMWGWFQVSGQALVRINANFAAAGVPLLVAAAGVAAPGADANPLAVNTLYNSRATATATFATFPKVRAQLARPFMA